MTAADEIRDLYRRYLEARREGDAEALASMYAEDGILIPPERPPIKGRAEICKYYTGPASSGVEIDLDHIEIKGELALVTGLEHWDSDGQRRYVAMVDAWRRENGEWRCVVCTWNSANGFAMSGR